MNEHLTGYVSAAQDLPTPRPNRLGCRDLVGRIDAQVVDALAVLTQESTHGGLLVGGVGEPEPRLVVVAGLNVIEPRLARVEMHAVHRRIRSGRCDLAGDAEESLPVGLGLLQA